MQTKTPGIISVVVTVLLLLAITAVSTLLIMLALNGASEKQGTIALAVSLGCNGLGVILSGIFANWFTKLALTKFNWSSLPAVIVGIVAGAGIGGVMIFISFFMAVLSSGVR